MNNRQITVPLVTRTGLHVGAGRGDAVTDALVRRDGAGRPVLPGTSLAGALREIATRLAPRLDLPSARPLCKALDGNDGKPCGCVVCQLFGDINPGQPSEDNVGQTVVATAARLWVYDAYPPGNTSGWIRDGVGIERAARVAHRKGRVKFDLETLPPGTKFELRLELEAGTPEQQAVEEKLIAAVLAEQGHNPARALQGVRELAAWVARDDWAPILDNYARCVRITRAEPRVYAVDPARFEDDAERALFAAHRSAAAALSAGDREAAASGVIEAEGFRVRTLAIDPADIASAHKILGQLLTGEPADERSETKQGMSVAQARRLLQLTA